MSHARSPDHAPDIELADAASDDTALEALARRLAELGGRALLLGAPGLGKSTLARRLGSALSSDGPPARCIGADPGSPAFGPPGAVCLGAWREHGWSVVAAEALCSLDAGRFRLPLAAAVRRLTPRGQTAPLLVDGPGVVRGVAGAELLAALVEAARVGAVVHLQRHTAPPLLADALRALPVPVIAVTPAAAARRPGKPARARRRTSSWDAWLDGARTHEIDLANTAVLGTPPPREAPQQWRGRQAALIGADGTTAALGEIERLAGDRLALRCHRKPAPGLALLIRDARREPNGLLGSAGPDAADAVRYAPPADLVTDLRGATGPRPVVRAGPATAALVNGVLGDPLLHVRLQHRRRSLLFDLGEAGRLPARIAHQVSDVFLSHAHMDHITGFFWLARSRMGEFPMLRVFGPPGIADNVHGLLSGILWDRLASGGPSFAVAEYDGARMRRFRLDAAAPPRLVDERPVAGGLLLDEPDLRVRAAPLDHGYGTRVLAFALETPRSFNVRKERLAASGLAPGPWLTRLKALIAAGERAVTVTLPDGREAGAGALAADLLLDAPGIRLAYATDLADTPANRAALTRLAARAHTLFCEASFRIGDAAQAARTGHLTTAACAAIAERAGAERLVPFHFSQRYGHELGAVYDEIRGGFSRTVTPPLRDVEA